MLYAFNPLPSEIQKNNLKILQRATVINLILDITLAYFKILKPIHVLTIILFLSLLLTQHFSCHLP